jgi:hypothetical protein
MQMMRGQRAKVGNGGRSRAGSTARGSIAMTHITISKTSNSRHSVRGSTREFHPSRRLARIPQRSQLRSLGAGRHRHHISCRVVRQSRRELSSSLPSSKDRSRLAAPSLSRFDGTRFGSGGREAACKVIVKQRLCGSGMKWTDCGGAVVLSLRTLSYTPGRWEGFWSRVDRWGLPEAA